MDARVLQQVVEDLPEAEFVPADLDLAVGLQLHRPVRVDRSGRVHGLADDPGQIDRVAFERPALIQPREQEEIVDQHAHPTRLGLDASHRLLQILRARVRSATEELRVAADRRERGAELVRRIRDERPEPLLGPASLIERRLDLREHRVQREAEPSDLGPLVGGLDPA